MKNALSGFILDLFVFVFIVICGSYFFKDLPFIFKIIIFIFSFFIVEIIIVFVRHTSQKRKGKSGFW